MSRAVMRSLCGDAVGGRHRQQERIVEQAHGFDVRLGNRQGQHDHVEHAAREFAQQHLRLRLAQLDLQVGKAALQVGQDTRKHVGSERRNDAQRQAAGQHLAAVAGVVHEVARRGEDLIAAACDFAADVGEHHLARAPLDELDAEHLFQIANLHGERRLGDSAGLGGPAEMPEIQQVPSDT